MWGFNFASTDLRVETEEQVGALIAHKRVLSDCCCQVPGFYCGALTGSFSILKPDAVSFCTHNRISELRWYFCLLL